MVPLSLGVIEVSDKRPALRLELQQFPGGRDCRLLATYFDGIRSTTVDSRPIYLEPRPRCSGDRYSSAGRDYFPQGTRAYDCIKDISRVRSTSPIASGLQAPSLS